LRHLRHGSVGEISVFLPINLPLYSLVLFAAIPSLMADSVDVRLPAATPDWVCDVSSAAGLDRFFPRMHLLRVTRRQFVEGYASQAAAVIFTGRYESAEEVRRECPDAVFIFQGSGVNPIVIGADAELTDDLIERVVTARIFNGGQDCAAPDAFLVHRTKADAFVSALVDQARSWPVGGYGDPAVRIGPILNAACLDVLEERLDAMRADIVVGGNVDHAAAFVEPTVVVRPLAEHDELTEFFAPVFYVLVFDDDAELEAFFKTPEYVENAMYVSLFGQEPLAGLFESSTVLFDATVLDVEQGNNAFGGNGAKANYVARGNDIEVGPALMSETLARFVVGRPSR
jgi:acyl-CoA reductase-like NAD-dependent aldehyde dehydrogenase